MGECDASGAQAEHTVSPAVSHRPMPPLTHVWLRVQATQPAPGAGPLRRAQASCACSSRHITLPAPDLGRDSAKLTMRGLL